MQCSLPLRIARWFDERLTDLAVPPTSTVRIYGVELIDEDALGIDPGAARSVFLTEGADLQAAMSSDGIDEVLAFDATIALEFPWLTVGSPVARPGAYPRRERGRLVQVTMFDGSAANLRRYGELEVVSERRIGDAA